MNQPDKTNKTINDTFKIRSLFKTFSDTHVKFYNPPTFNIGLFKR